MIMKNLQEGSKATSSSSSALHPTMNDLPEKCRKKIVKLLNRQLADAIDLKLQLKQGHWNVKGPNFIALHKLFDKVAAEVDEMVDEIAERAVALGGTALGTAPIIASESTLPEYPLNISAASDHVDALSIALSCFGKSSRHAIKEFEDLNDADSADLMTTISRLIDKRLWMIESHSQPLRGA